MQPREERGESEAERTDDAALKLSNTWNER